MNTMRALHLTELDLGRLYTLAKDLLRQAGSLRSSGSALIELLEVAHVVAPEQISSEVVTMNSKVVFEELDTGRLHEVTICYPEDANPACNKISVLSPVGMALIGSKVNERVTVTLPDGGQKVVRPIKLVYQPEAAGEFEL